MLIPEKDKTKGVAHEPNNYRHQTLNVVFIGILIEFKDWNTGSHVGILYPSCELAPL
jgi:hypothetical protein